MKPPVFEYFGGTDLDEILGLLERFGDEGKVLAGGQSLVPLLNFRLASPARLVDINGVGALAYIRRQEGVLRIGALTRQAILERSAVVAEHWPLLTEAIRFVAHAQIRNRGTVGGSVAHADPAAELPVALAALDARVRVRSTRGERTIPWHELFVTHLTTSLEPDELLTEIEVPPLPDGAGWAFTEYSRRHGDFALGGAAAVVAFNGKGCREARISLLGAADTPLRPEAAERGLLGSQLDQEAVAEAARVAVEEIEPTGDIHGGSEYRRQLIEAMVRRALTAAAQRARR